MRYFIQTFGCQANKADSERIAGVLEAMGLEQTKQITEADVVVLNTCSVRQSAEDRVYARMAILRELKKTKPNLKIVVAGCMIGPHGAHPRDSTIAQRLRGADKLVGTQDYSQLWEIFKDLKPTPKEYLPAKLPYKKMEKDHGYVLISSGCNNFCAFCIVPYARGKEISRPMQEILDEVKELADKGYTKITLLGQNVNSYGADLIVGKPLGGDRIQLNELRKYRKEQKAKQYIQQQEIQNRENKNTDIATAVRPGPFHDMADIEEIAQKEQAYVLPSGKVVKPVKVKHLGKIRIPTLFPYLLEEVCAIDGVKQVDFLSSNPWDFSDELIDTIAQNEKISRHIHLPVQSGDNNVLQRMNRWYTREEYLTLIQKIKTKIPQATFGTDIIVGFPGETEEEFQQTVDLCKKVGYTVAYIAEYSVRPGTAASLMKDSVPSWEKKRRFQILDELTNGVKHTINARPKIQENKTINEIYQNTANKKAITESNN